MPEDPKDIPKRPRGRPKKSEIAAKKKGGRGVRGRPKGDAAILNEYKARMLNSPKSELVLRKVFDAALDDEHPHQAACLKMVMERIAPVKAFEQDMLKSNGKSAIQINISTTGASVESKDVSDRIIEGEIVDDA